MKVKKRENGIQRSIIWLRQMAQLSTTMSKNKHLANDIYNIKAEDINNNEV